MKAIIKPKIVYEVIINEKNHGEFKKTGELSGMIEMKQGNKMLVIDRGRNRFDAIFDSLGGEQEVDIVKASNELVE